MDQKFLQLALEQAKLSMEKGGFPAGSVIVKNREVIGTGISIGNILHDPTSHGEINAIRNACQNIFSSDLSECIIYSSLEPCLMCLNACSWANLPKVVYACGKDLTNPLFYGNRLSANEVNQNFLKPIELIHDESLEEASLEVLREWGIKHNL